MATTVQEALQKGKLYTDPEKYTFLRLAPSQWAEATKLMGTFAAPTNKEEGGFRGLLLDKDEITLMLPTKAYEEVVSMEQDSILWHKKKVAQASYRLITFDAILDPNLVGFMHTITGALAAHAWVLNCMRRTQRTSIGVQMAF